MLALEEISNPDCPLLLVRVRQACNTYDRVRIVSVCASISLAELEELHKCTYKRRCKNMCKSGSAQFGIQPRDQLHAIALVTE